MQDDNVFEEMVAIFERTMVLVTIQLDRRLMEIIGEDVAVVMRFDYNGTPQLHVFTRHSPHLCPAKLLHLWP